MLTKDKAYLAAGKCVEKWRGLKGEDNQNYLKANFDETWNNYDVKGKNKIEESEAYQLLKEIWSNSRHVIDASELNSGVFREQ